MLRAVRSICNVRTRFCTDHTDESHLVGEAMRCRSYSRRCHLCLVVRNTVAPSLPWLCLGSCRIVPSAVHFLIWSGQCFSCKVASRVMGYQATERLLFALTIWLIQKPFELQAMQAACASVCASVSTPVHCCLVRHASSASVARLANLWYSILSAAGCSSPGVGPCVGSMEL